MISLTTNDGRDTHVAVAADEASLLADLPIVGEGFARCCPEDVFDAAVGEGIALGRAIQDFGRQVEAAFQARVVTRDEFNRVLDHIAGRTDIVTILGVEPGDIVVVAVPE